MHETHDEQYHILATASRVDDRTRVLKHGDTFAVFDQYGDIQPAGLGEEGLYHGGTRFLSRFEVTLNGRPPLLLSSTVLQDNSLLSVDLTNHDVQSGDHLVLGRETVHIFRQCFLREGMCYTRLRVRSYAREALQLTMRMAMDADYADIFEVRGTRRSRHGRMLPPAFEADGILFGYEGLDGATRHTRLSWSPAPDRLNATAAWFDIQLSAKEERTYEVTVACELASQVTQAKFEPALEIVQAERAEASRRDAAIRTSNALFNGWLDRSAADLHMMVTQTPFGPYPYAGVPWFSTVFGRDGIITALEYLWLNPDMARGVLSYLAATQSRIVNDQQDAEPGKILHETRAGEMAALGEIPFGKYYGSVDATPLFVMLAGAYYERTADFDFVLQLWPHVERALDWIERYGDQDGDGFCEYARHSSQGLISQGWKDSFDAVFHADGKLAEAPLALAEVQGYVYAARTAAARLAEVLGHYDRAKQLWDAAEKLRKAFDHAFWCDDLGTYALALDRFKQPCHVRTSNAGHCLFTGIALPERAPTVAQTLLAEESFSGWGIRTVATTESRYNPMAYHNGSIWPHDNALVAHGLARYGLQHDALRVLCGLFDASTYFELRRMPELFCGFPRRSGAGPTLYPVACSPQSWAAGAVFFIMQACLGLTIDAPRGQVRFNRPVLPEALTCVTIRNLKVGNAEIDLILDRYVHDVGLSVSRKQGNVQILAVK